MAIWRASIEATTIYIRRILNLKFQIFKDCLRESKKVELMKDCNQKRIFLQLQLMEA